MINPSNNSFSYTNRKDSIIILFKNNQKKLAARFTVLKIRLNPNIKWRSFRRHKIQTQFFKKLNNFSFVK